VKGEPWLREFLAQEPVITRDVRQQVDWLVRGQYPIAMSPNPATITEYRQQGVGLNLQRLAPNSEAGSRLLMVRAIALVNRPPHPNAARLFANWALSREGQALYTKHLEELSRRLDVEGPADKRPDPAASYRPVNREEYAHYLDRVLEILNETLK
jgi:ABC-type Fe3+ transport system substrate-binding protein